MAGFRFAKSIREILPLKDLARHSGSVLCMARWSKLSQKEILSRKKDAYFLVEILMEIKG